MNTSFEYAPENKAAMVDGGLTAPVWRLLL
jgi:hypothetical protein